MADRLIDLLRRVSPRARLRVAAWIALLATVGWPISQVTIAREEPPFVLGLSWLALILTAVNLILTADVRDEQDG